MGSSGLLLVGVVALWLFGAMPHWVRRSEALAAEHVANEPFSQRTVPPRRRAASPADAATSGAILGRPRRDDGPRRAIPGVATVDERPAASRAEREEVLHGDRAAQRRSSVARVPPAPRQRRQRRRVLAPLVLVAVLVAAAVAAPALLAVGGASTTTVALSALALAALGVAVLGLRARRAAVRRRALARRRARPWLVPSSTAGRRAVRRPRADEGPADRRHAVGA